LSANSAPRILADVNLWLATIVESHPHHERAIGWWQQRVVGTDRTAWNLVDAVGSQEPVGYLDEPAGLEPTLREFTATQPRWPELWTDAYLAAFARTTGTRLTTFDRGFRRFAGLDLELLG